MRRILLLLAAIFIVGGGANCNKNLVPDLSFKLSGTELAFPCESTKTIYKTSGRYVPKNVIATRMQILKDDAFIALPRYKHGVPFTLAKFSLKQKGCHAILEPYSCWSLQEEGNCEALQNVIDIFIDANEILWALDLGICNTLEQPVRRCPPKLVGINTATKQIVKVADLSSFVTADSRIQYLIVDYAPDGKAFVYISDAGTGSIIVYDVLLGTGYRVVLPKACATDSDGKECTAVLYMALSRKSYGNVLYFTFLASPRLFSIKASYLQKGQASGAVVDVGPKPPGTKIVLLGTDNGAGLFFRYKGESDVFIWNSDTAFKPQNFLLVQQGGECRLPTQVVPGYKRLMWAIESNFHDYIADTTGCLGPSMAVHPLIKTCD